MTHRSQWLASLLLSCAAVAWQGCESSDGPGSGAAGYAPEECSLACAQIAAADCGDVGEGCFDRCVSFPQAQFQGSCQVELRDYLDCFWQAASYACGGGGGGDTTPLGCAAERQKYLVCSGDGASAEGGAGAAGSAAGSGGASP